MWLATPPSLHLSLNFILSQHSFKVIRFVKISLFHTTRCSLTGEIKLTSLDRKKINTKEMKFLYSNSQIYLSSRSSCLLQVSSFSKTAPQVEMRLIWRIFVKTCELPLEFQLLFCLKIEAFSSKDLSVFILPAFLAIKMIQLSIKGNSIYSKTDFISYF